MFAALEANLANIKGEWSSENTVPKVFESGGDALAAQERRGYEVVWADYETDPLLMKGRIRRDQTYHAGSISDAAAAVSRHSRTCIAEA